MSVRRTMAVLAVLMSGVAVAVPAGAQTDPATGWIRLGHFAPGGTTVDVVVDGAVRATGLGPGSVTPYVRVTPGTHRVEARAVGGTTALVDVEAGVEANASVTIGVVSTLDGVGAQVYDDAENPPAEGRALVRFIHTVPDVPAVDVAVVGGPVLASNVAYPAATPYLDVAPGTYDIELRRAGSAEVLLQVDQWRIAAGAEATVVVSSRADGSLDVVPLLDAGGTGSMPAGGAATGFGGTADRFVGAPSDPAVWVWCWVVVAAIVVGALLLGRPRTRSALTVAASIGLAGCAGTRPQSAPAPTAPTTTTTTSTLAATTVPVASGANVNEPIVGDPVAVRIPSLGVSSSLVPLGRADDGSVEVPSTADQAGWYDRGPRPGDIGPAVILGHVDSQDGPGVFATLDRIAPGDVVVVDTTSGPVTFVAERSERVAKAAFPSDAVYGAAPEPELRLITCGGAFDRSTGHYVDNVVVYLRAAGT